jgi:hypothetical protein
MVTFWSELLRQHYLCTLLEISELFLQFVQSLGNGDTVDIEASIGFSTGTTSCGIRVFMDTPTRGLGLCFWCYKFVDNN